VDLQPPIPSSGARLLWLLLLLLQPVVGFAATGEYRVEGPNHYIVLVDASGSVFANAARTKAFRRASQTLLHNLYVAGFDNQAPAFRNGVDYLSVYHFGIVQGDVANAYRRLRNKDFAREYMHPLVEAQRRVSPDWLASRLQKPVTYNYTAYSWAKPFGLWKARSRAHDLRIGRTFVVVLTDTLPNGGTLNDEIIEIERWIQNTRLVQQERQLRHRVSERYYFGTAEGMEGLAWERVLRVSDDFHVVTEVFEVFAKERETARNQSSYLLPLAPTQFKWLVDRPRRPVAELEIRFTDEFSHWLQGSHALTLSITAEFESHSWHTVWDGLGAPHLRLPFADAAPRAGSAGKLIVQAVREEPDPWLGRSTTRYSWEQPLTMERRPHDTLAALLLPLGEAMGLVLLAVCVYNVRWAQHLKFSVPGLGKARPLPRDSGATIHCPIAPLLNAVALEALLPPTWKQVLFCRGETVRIRSRNGGDVRWRIGRNLHDTLVLPLERKRVAAYWVGLPEGEGGVELLHRRHGREGTYTMEHADAMQTASEARRALPIIVGLDLGSESMAASMVLSSSLQPEILPLQEHAASLVGQLGPPGSPDGGQVAALLYDDAYDDEESDDVSGGEEKRRDTPGENVGKVESRRLRTRIALADGCQPPELPETHALLDFHSDGNYARSLFRYFLRRGQQALAANKWMPNPKIPFMLGARSILPEVASTTKNANVLVQPDQLITHMIVQVVRNFVLRNSFVTNAVRNAPLLADTSGKLAPSNVHLVITVPNVYSVAHVKEIERFLSTCKIVGNVSLIYESDAIVQFALWRDHANSPWEDERFAKELEREEEEGSDYYLVTIDVGRGTTDLSMAYLGQPQDREQPPVSSPSVSLPTPSSPAAARTPLTVLARSGVSSGGNRLDYILAAYYNSRVSAVFHRYGEELLGGDLANRVRRRDRPPFDFCCRRKGERALLPNQGQALELLDPLIFRVKRSMDEQYRVELKRATQRKLIVPVVESLLREISENWQDEPSLFLLRELLVQAMLLPACDPKLSMTQRWRHALQGWRSRRSTLRGERTGQGMQELRRLLDGVLTVCRVPASSAAPDVPSGEQERVASDSHPLVPAGQAQRGEHATGKPRQDRIARLEEFLTDHPVAVRLAAPKQGEIDALEKSLDDYVNLTIRVQLDDLFEMAGRRADKSNSNFEFRPDDAFVVVAGQASQFRPIKRAICGRLAAKRISPHRIAYLVGRQAKEACCLGAVHYVRANHDLRNKDELFGRYGFLGSSRVPGDKPYGSLDMHALNKHLLCTPEPPFLTEQFRSFVFTSHVFDDGKVPRVGDGMTAMIGGYFGTDYIVQYLSENDPEPLQLAITHRDGRQTVKPVSHPDTPDDIWPNIWPEQLPESAQ
jgi:hypothetical protein